MTSSFERKSRGETIGPYDLAVDGLTANTLSAVFQLEPPSIGLIGKPDGFHVPQENGFFPKAKVGMIYEVIGRPLINAANVAGFRYKANIFYEDCETITAETLANHFNISAQSLKLKLKNRIFEPRDNGGFSELSNENIYEIIGDTMVTEGEVVAASETIIDISVPQTFLKEATSSIAADSQHSSLVRNFEAAEHIISAVAEVNCVGYKLRNVEIKLANPTHLSNNETFESAMYILNNALKDAFSQGDISLFAIRQKVQAIPANILETIVAICQFKDTDVNTERKYREQKLKEAQEYMKTKIAEAKAKFDIPVEIVTEISSAVLSTINTDTKTLNSIKETIKKLNTLGTEKKTKLEELRKEQEKKAEIQANAIAKLQRINKEYDSWFKNHYFWNKPRTVRLLGDNASDELVRNFIKKYITIRFPNYADMDKHKSQYLEEINLLLTLTSSSSSLVVALTDYSAQLALVESLEDYKKLREKRTELTNALNEDTKRREENSKNVQYTEAESKKNNVIKAEYAETQATLEVQKVTEDIARKEAELKKLLADIEDKQSDTQNLGELVDTLRKALASANYLSDKWREILQGFNQLEVVIEDVLTNCFEEYTHRMNNPAGEADSKLHFNMWFKRAIEASCRCMQTAGCAMIFQGLYKEHVTKTIPMLSKALHNGKIPENLAILYGQYNEETKEFNVNLENSRAREYVDKELENLTKAIYLKLEEHARPFQVKLRSAVPNIAQNQQTVLEESNEEVTNQEEEEEEQEED